MEQSDRLCYTVITRHHNLSDKYMQNFAKLAFRELKFWQLTFWEEPSNLRPPPPHHGKTLRLRRTRRRLELTVPPYIECSYLLANDTPTKRLAMQQQARIASWWWCENCIAFLTAHCAFIDNFMILCPAELSHYKLYRKPHETVTDNQSLLFPSRALQREGFC